MRKKKIILYTLLLISCLSYEFLFSNSLFLKGKNSYIFSIPRLLLYILLFFIASRVSNRIINNRIKFEENKKKKNIVDAFLIISFIFIILADLLYLVLGKTNVMSQGIILILLCYIVFLFLFYGTNYKLNILLLCAVCFIYSMVVTPMHAIDETSHFLSSYNISRFDYNWDNGYEFDTNLYTITRFKNYSFNEELFKHYTKEKMTNKDMWYKPYKICKYMYIPSSIGIFVSEKLNGTIMDTFYLGRFFNSLITIVGIALLLKITNYHKNIYISILTTPYFLLLGSTYNVDAIGNICVLLFVSYIINLYKSKDKYLNKNNTLIITVLMLSICLYKGASYFLIFLLLFLIKNKIPKKYKWLSIIYFIVFSLIIYSQMKPDSLNTGDVSITGNPNTKEQLKFLFSSPIVFIKVYGLHFINTILNVSYYEGLLGTYFYPLCSKYFLGFYLIYLVYMTLTEDNEVFNIKDKIYNIIVFLLIFFFTSTGLYLGYTGVGRINIEGYQTRYLFPILPLLLITLSNKRIKIVKDEKYDIINYGLILFLNISFIIIIVFFNAYEYWIK